MGHSYGSSDPDGSHASRVTADVPLTRSVQAYRRYVGVLIFNLAS